MLDVPDTPKGYSRARKIRANDVASHPMNAPSRVAAFAALLAVVLGGAALAGAAIDPTDAPPARVAAHGSAPGGAHGGTTGAGAGAATGSRHAADGGHAATGGAEHGETGGLAVSAGGLTLAFDRTRLSSAASTPLRFRIVDDAGRTVRDGYDVEHERELHLIVVRRDTQAFQHVHPRRGADGVWTADVDTTRAGVYRAYADLTRDGTRTVLATDLFVPGAFDPRPLPAPSGTAAAVDPGGAASGVDVALRSPRLRAGREATLTFTATRGSGPAPMLQPYLGAKGHLVALREGDLAYLHAHPAYEDAHAGAAGDEHGHDAQGTDEHATAPHEHAANETRFATTFPTAGRYRLFLQVRTDGRVRTAAFTVEVGR